MLIRITESKRRFYDDEGDELYGQCSFQTPQRMSIRISRPLNRKVNTFAGTLLHEMLHAWVNMLERKGFQTDEEREEKFIRRAEKIVIRQFGKQFHKGR